MSYLFFVSYARATRSLSVDEEDLKRFVKDLTNEVSQLDRPQTSEVAFFDTLNIETGNEWPDDLDEALRTSRVCVSLYSPGYFNSKWCGREFHVFRERRQKWLDHPSNQGKKAPVIRPVLWIRTRNLPGGVQAFQYTDDNYPKTYEQHGLRQMLRLSALRDDYYRFLAELAQKIVDAATLAPMPDMPALDPLNDLPSAFDEAPDAATPAAVTGGVSKACFVFLASPKLQARGLRQTLDSYGDTDGWGWRPYHPDPEPVGALAQQIAGQMGLRFQELECTPDLPERLREAKKNHVPTVLIADAWSACLSKFRNVLSEYDDLNLANCAVLVPWNENDTETITNREKLRQHLRNACPQKFTSPPPNHLWDSVFSPADLRAKTTAALENVRMRVLELLMSGRGGRQEVRKAEDRSLAEAAPVALDTAPQVQNVHPSGTAQQ